MCDFEPQNISKEEHDRVCTSLAHAKYHISGLEREVAALKAENERLNADLFKEKHHAKLFLEERDYAEGQLRSALRGLWLSRARAAETGRRFWAKEDLFAQREGRRRDAEKAWKMEKRRERQVALFTAKAEEVSK